MPLAFALPLLVLAIAPTVGAESARPLECARAQRVELGGEPTRRPPEVCVSPGEPTHFLFDAPLREGGVQLEERERFVDMAEGERSVTVYPSERVVAGKPLTLTACFADGAAPACASFLLVPRVGQATGKVTVVRPPPPEVDLQRELTRQRALVGQLQSQLARTRAECRGLAESRACWPRGSSATASPSRAPTSRRESRTREQETSACTRWQPGGPGAASRWRCRCATGALNPGSPRK